MLLERGSDSIHALQDFLGSGRVGYLEAEILIERDDQLQGVHGIQPQAIRPEQGLVITNLLSGHLEHEVFHHQRFDARFQFSLHAIA